MEHMLLQAILNRKCVSRQIAPVWTVLWVPFKQILIPLTSVIVIPNSARVLYKTSLIT